MEIKLGLQTAILAVLLLFRLPAVPADANGMGAKMTCNDENGSCAWSVISDNLNGNFDQQGLPEETATTAPAAALTTNTDCAAANCGSGNAVVGHAGGEHVTEAAGNLAKGSPAMGVTATTAGPSCGSPLPFTTNVTTSNDAGIASASANLNGSSAAGAEPELDVAPEGPEDREAVKPAEPTAERAASAANAPPDTSPVPSSSSTSGTPAGARGGSEPVLAPPLSVDALAAGSVSDAVTGADVTTGSRGGGGPDAGADADASSSEEPAVAAAMAAADAMLQELRGLLGQARSAVVRLEAEVTRQARRLALLTAVKTPMAVTAGSANVADPAVEAATLAALRSLGMDSGSTSAAARQALRDVLQQILREQMAVGFGTSAAYNTVAAAAAVEGGGGGAVAVEDWFGRHFALRAAARLTSPPPSAADANADASAPAAAAPAIAASVATCAFAYELPHPDPAAAGGGALQYIVVGDTAGSLNIVRPADGALLAAVPTGTDSPVTACSAYFVRRYESTIVTGHANGQTRSFAVLLHEVQEEEKATDDFAAAAPPRPDQRLQSRQRQREGRTALSTKIVVQSVQLRHVVESMPPGALPWAAVEELSMMLGKTTMAEAESMASAAASTVATGPAATGADATAAAGSVTEPSPYTGPPAPIMHILPYRLGHKATGRRHVLVLDRAGNLRLDRDNGTLRFWARTNRTQLAARFVGTHVVMLSSYHATLMNTLQPRQPRAYTCHNLNGSRLLVASFDGHRSFRAFGVNGRGELLSLVTPHEGALATCKVHRATPLEWLDAAKISEPTGHHSLSLTALRGYLLLTHGSHHVLFNVTGIIRTGIPALASASDGLIAHVANTATPPLPSYGNAAAASVTAGLRVAAASTRIGGLLPSPPVVTVGPGSQVVVLALPPPPSPVTASVAADGDDVATFASPMHDQSSMAPHSPPPSALWEASAAAAGIGGSASSGVGDNVGPGGGGIGPSLLVVLDTRMPRPPMSGGTSKIWSQPVFVAAIMLVGLYQFWRMSSTRQQRRSMPSASRGIRGRRGQGAGYGGSMFGDATEYMYGEGRVPFQSRSALRRGRFDRPMGRTVTYEDDDY